MAGRIVLTIGILLLVLWSTASTAQAPRPIATVETLVGDCTVVRFGAANAAPLAVGAGLSEGDRVQTRAGARLKLEFVDGTVVQLGENTDLTVDWYLYAPDASSQSVLLRVSRGIFRVILDFVLPNEAFDRVPVRRVELQRPGVGAHRLSGPSRGGQRLAEAVMAVAGLGIGLHVELEDRQRLLDPSLAEEGVPEDVELALAEIPALGLLGADLAVPGDRGVDSTVVQHPGDLVGDRRPRERRLAPVQEVE